MEIRDRKRDKDLIKLKLLKIDLKIFKNTKEKRDRRRLYKKEQVIGHI
ncbi:hypothetical protein CLOSCI_03297 [[Clostridium] scindens ATCC 35704]|nr:hypothetical protein CLOSCI_03297 [[Clostridium] scindens ATCC 35704]